MQKEKPRRGINLLARDQANKGGGANQNKGK